MRSIVRAAASVIAVTLWLATPRSEASEVVTIAGNSQAGYTGDSGPAAKAMVGGPFGVTLGPDAALYVCETTNHVIRRIDEATGRISTVAGCGQKGYTGDGGPATMAKLGEPYEVRFDRDGHMYFVEMVNHIVRRVDAKTSLISTVAGCGKAGFAGDGGPATRAKLHVPHSITLDLAGNLYVCDIGNHRIRRVNLTTGLITTFGGTGERRATPDGAPLAGTPLNGPRALDFDGHGSLFLALREGNQVFRIDLAAQTLHHLAGTGQQGFAGDGGDAKRALLSGPKGIAVGPDGDVFLADTESHTIRVIRADGGTIETLVGDGRQGDGPDGTPRRCRLARPHGLFVSKAGDVYIGDSSNHRVRKLIRNPPVTGAAVGWQRIQLDAAFRSEGVAVADVNRDGRRDVLAGDVWYEAPGWTMHAIRPVKKFVAETGYSDCFANFAWDVNRDGWTDLIYVSYPGLPCFWLENPRNAPRHWTAHPIWHSACNESPAFADLDGDGRPELILGSQPEAKLGFLPLPSTTKVTMDWTFRAISRAGDPQTNGTFRYYHGLGVGDLNNDGRTDVVIPHGWWEHPAHDGGGPWEFHPLRLAKDANSPPLPAANLYPIDLDLDGDNDIVMSSAHTFGVWWFENIGGNAAPKFRYHLIDESFSQTHALESVDINGDGTPDFVTGKRFFAHNGRDPGERDPVVMVWYELHRRNGSPPKFIRHEIVAGRDTGIGTQFLVTDIDRDGLPDVALSNKKGVNLLLQRRGHAPAPSK